MSFIESNCAVCGGTSPDGSVCSKCTDRYPLDLIKVHLDEFPFAVRLRSGELFVFTRASITGDWVKFDGIQSSEPAEFGASGGGRPMTFDRGITVRISDIVWIADAPWGS